MVLPEYSIIFRIIISEINYKLRRTNMESWYVTKF